jgi:beta-glucuronidase
MLSPQSNPFRQQVDLSGFWDLRFDPQNEGDSANWSSGFSDGRPAAVPASWNDQFEDGRDYLGLTWYQTTFDLPWGWDGGRHTIHLYFESVNYLAEVWLNGAHLGTHEGGHLPFAFDITSHAQRERNHLVVRVDGQLAPDRVPPGNLLSPDHGFANSINFPAGSFDFFPFAGIQRAVRLAAIPRDGLNNITVITNIEGRAGRVHVHLDAGENVSARVSLRGTPIFTETLLSGNHAELILDVPDAQLWSPSSPYLYDLVVELSRSGSAFDQYHLPIGIRTVKVEGDQLLLNGKPIYLRGFGRHEDFPIAGRGIVPLVIIKDYALMKWMGANSFRTTHYPYSEAMMSLADQLGFLVIDETPIVGMFFDERGLPRRSELSHQYLEELIARDKNHPSVIMWSLANEPHSARQPQARTYFQSLSQRARELDATRPITVASYVGADEPAYEFVDVLCLNRYIGWYVQAGRLDSAFPMLSQELDEIYQKWQKPIVVSEFGADAISGHHAQPPEMFSEEYQAEMITGYLNVFRTKPYIIGEHIWNLCDFKTGQAVNRVASLNLKGIFTRDRRPKLAAHRLRALWSDDAQ